MDAEFKEGGDTLLQALLFVIGAINPTRHEEIIGLRGRKVLESFYYSCHNNLALSLPSVNIDEVYEYLLELVSRLLDSDLKVLGLTLEQITEIRSWFELTVEARVEQRQSKSS